MFSLSFFYVYCEVLVRPKSSYSLQLGPRVLMYNTFLENDLCMHSVNKLLCIVLKTCGNKYVSICEFVNYMHNGAQFVNYYYSFIQYYITNKALHFWSLIGAPWAAII